MEPQQKKPRFEAQPPNFKGIEPSKEVKADFIPEIRVSTKDLPSRGIPYPEGSWIIHRPYMFGEVKKISQSKLDNKASYGYILSGVTCSFDKNLLTMPDVLYIGLLRKLSTLGSTEIIARYQCDQCGKPGQFIFKTDSLDFEDLNVPKLPIVVDMSFGEVHFSPMTIKDYLMMADKGKDQDEVALYAVQAKNMNFDEAYTRIFNASPEDAQLLLEVDKLLYHSVKPITKTCANLVDEKPCGKHVKIELDGGQALLLPFRRDQGTAKTKIRFGLENER